MRLVNPLTMRKGQLTIFMILGFVLLVIFLMIFYFINSMAEIKIESESRKATISTLTAPVIEFSISDALGDVLKEGLIQIGLQGGYFYKGQPGYPYSPEYPIPFPYNRFNQNNVSYLIYKEFYIPEWPCYSSSYEPSYCRFINKGQSHWFGKFRIPELSLGSSSIRAQLEKYIAEELPNYINFELIEEQFPGYTISPGEPEPYVYFGIASTTVQLTYPITIKFQDYDDVVVVQEFKKQVPIRFSRLYSIAKEIIEGDTLYLDFDITKEVFDVPRYSAEISFTPAQSDSNIFDDVFILNDFYIRNEPYVFQFTRKNRPPVLDYISKSPSYLYDTSNSLKDIYDYLAVPNVPGINKINITPKAIDPDEDEVFYYSESHPFISNLTKGFNHTLNLVYTVNESDAGFYNITINATDRQFEDSQRIRLLIDNPLRPNISIYNLYEDPGVYSQEDLFFLNATATNKTLDRFATYYFRWQDYTMDQRFLLETTASCVVLPSRQDCSDQGFNIENITEYGLDYYLTEIGEEKGIDKSLYLDINLSYTEFSQFNRTTIKVTRKKCIPYRSSEPSYPYNTDDPTNISAFYGNHSCCNEDYTIKGTEAVCFEDLKCYQDNLNLWEIKHYCDGNRGNICGGNDIVWNPTNLCGAECGADSNCETQFGNATGGGWCYSKDGCEKVCNTELVDDETSGRSDGDECDCELLDGDLDKNCDSNHDGNYSGTCQRVGITIECVGDS